MNSMNSSLTRHLKSGKLEQTYLDMSISYVPVCVFIYLNGGNVFKRSRYRTGYFVPMGFL